MPPVFRESSFAFEEGQEVPSHVEGRPDLSSEPDKFGLKGRDTFDLSEYPLASGIDDEATLQVLYTARQRAIDRDQGDSENMRDTISIVAPQQS
jgi:hypothetical protein